MKMDTCAEGQKDAAAGSSTGQKDAAAGSSVNQFCAGKQA
jgi:hypothetical protein